jgi:hypothetical protein
MTLNRYPPGIRGKHSEKSTGHDSIIGGFGDLDEFFYAAHHGQWMKFSYIVLGLT